ncbi:MAG: Gfo/Idh/MocA family protein [Anaerolineae bacterium]
MRVGMAGLQALYWPMAIGKGLQAKGVEFVAATALGVEDERVAQALGATPQEYAARFGLRLYPGAEEMIAAEELDTVVLISRHSEHAAWVQRLAPLGVNLFIPKTFTTTNGDAEAVVAAGKRYGVQIAVGPSARFLPPFLAVKRALDEGLIGRPFSMRLCHHHGTIDVFDAADWYRDPQEGGPELSLGWYGVDLMLHFMQEQPVSVLAQYGNYTSPGSPFMDCGRIVLGFQGGAQAAFDMYFCHRSAYPSWQLELVGPRGILSIHRVEGDSSRTVVALDGPEGYRLLPVPQETPDWEMFWVDDLLQGRPPAVDAEQAARITRLTLAARDSAHNDQVVRL